MSGTPWHATDVVTTEVDDMLEHEGQAVVLVGSQVMLLSPLAAQVVRVAQGGATLNAVGEHLVEVFGPPSDGLEPLVHVVSMVTDLERAGVLVRGGQAAS